MIKMSRLARATGDLNQCITIAYKTNAPLFDKARLSDAWFVAHNSIGLSRASLPVRKHRCRIAVQRKRNQPFDPTSIKYLSLLRWSFEVARGVTIV